MVECEGLGWDKFDAQEDWQALLGAYVFFMEGAKQASTKIIVERSGGKFIARATQCNRQGRSGYQHKVLCCAMCHQVRTDPNKTARTAILGMERLLYSTELLAKGELSKSDVAFLRHAIVERPAHMGNGAFARLRDAVKTRLTAETA